MSTKNGYGKFAGSINLNVGDYIREAERRQEVIHNHNEKPLAIMVAYRSRPQTRVLDFSFPLTPPNEFTSPDFVNDITVTNEHRALAQEIASFYRDRMVMRKLLGKQPKTSEFVTDLIRALELNDQYQSKEAHHGILYRIYDFYHEDQAHESLALNHVSHSGIPTSVIGCGVIYADLKFVKKVFQARRTRKSHLYYFRDSQNQLYRIPAPDGHPLTPLVNMLTQARTFSLSGDLYEKQLCMDHREFHVMEPASARWEILDLEV